MLSVNNIVVNSIINHPQSSFWWSQMTPKWLNGMVDWACRITIYLSKKAGFHSELSVYQRIGGEEKDRRIGTNGTDMLNYIYIIL